MLTIIVADIGAKTYMQMVMKKTSATSSLFANLYEITGSIFLFLLFSMEVRQYAMILQITGLVDEDLLNDYQDHQIVLCPISFSQN